MDAKYLDPDVYLFVYEHISKPDIQTSPKFSACCLWHLFSHPVAVAALHVKCTTDGMSSSFHMLPGNDSF